MASVRKRKWTHKGEERTAWVVSYIDLGGTQRLKTLPSKKEADAYRASVESELLTATHIPAHESPTIAQAAAKFLAHCEARNRAGDKMALSTLRVYRLGVRKYINPKLGRVKLCDLRASMVQRWVDELFAEGASLDTLRDCRNGLRQIIALAQRHDMVATNVMKDAPPRLPGQESPPIDIPNRKEVAHILATADGRMRPVVHLAIFAGLRNSEIRALAWKHVDFRNNLILVRRAMDRDGKFKGPKSESGIRDIPMAPPLAAVLQEWRKLGERLPVADDVVFSNSKGNPIDADTFHQAWTHHMQEIGLSRPISECNNRRWNAGRGLVSKYHFHALRHVCASLLIEQGCPIMVVSKFMGHSEVRITENVYGHLFEDNDQAAQAVAKLGDQIANSA